jgi:zinc finger HIT domain-containing protein 1
MPHIEVLPNTSTAATPGWTYVVDTGYDPSKTAINPTSGKRTRTHAAPGGAEVTSRQERARVNRLRELDNDSVRDIPIPRKSSTAFKPGTTTNTRRVVSSMKKFENYLSDEEAELAQKTQPQISQITRKPSARERRGSTRPSVALPDPMDVDEDVPHPLLKVDVPKRPSKEEIEALLAEPPLSYNASKADPGGPNSPPPRLFCDTCGYWGRIRCMMCGARVCGLECKGDHQERCNRIS